MMVFKRSYSTGRQEFAEKERETLSRVLTIFSATEKYLLCSITKSIEGNLCALKTSSSFKIIMRDITTMQADVIAQKPARFERVQTLPALSWGAPYYLQLCGAFIQHPSACQTPPAVQFQMGNSEWTQQHCYMF